MKLAAQRKPPNPGRQSTSPSHIETERRGVSDLEMVILARALRIALDDLVPRKLPKWKKDLRPPTAQADGDD